ncbi:hypothetical protein [Streptomyces sp. NPDC057909]|uniref:hypothetical protein n=1 Tax=Streptomyces sp. NPDC057909 TaxID=3346277 RepID=UPI0036EF1C1D
MTWNESAGTVSRAFDEWLHSERNIRAFLRLSTAWSERGYDSSWSRAEESFAAVFDPDRHYGDEHVDIFDSSVGGLWPTDYTWMLQAATLKDAVTAFEVYLEKALEEALHRRRYEKDGQRVSLRLAVGKNQESPGWRTIVAAHRVLGTIVDTDSVKEVRALRHLLTHQHGELRTEEIRERFCEAATEATLEEYERSYVGGKVHLGEARVLKCLDWLGAVVRSADPPVWEIEWGQGTLPAEELYSAKCVELVRCP